MNIELGYIVNILKGTTAMPARCISFLGDLLKLIFVKVVCKVIQCCDKSSENEFKANKQTKKKQSYSKGDRLNFSIESHDMSFNAKVMTKKLYGRILSDE